MGQSSVGKKTLKIEKCVQGGAGLARLPNGSVCFVEGALPGELAEIKITEQKKDFAKASVVKILEPHSKRRNPPCPYYGKCGGCNAQYAQFDLQIELLRQIVLDLFSRIAKINLPPNFEIHYGSEWGYRFRAQVFAPGGFQMRGSNIVIPIEKCMVLSDKLNEKLKATEKTYLFDNQSEKFLGKYIHANESVFFQSNLELLPKLIEEACKAAGEGKLLFDVFCGVGLFSAFLQDKFERVIAIEQNPLCKKFAEKNLGKNCEFYATNAEEWNDFGGCVLIDPPRAGLTNKLFNKLKCDKIIYVSCSPATLARDTRKLLDAGYELASVQGFAFYPQTFHLEMMAVFIQGSS
ncbi:MAG: TRAM domain-containing protein [Fibromonadales bacterium]|nr:TRAM domain-containing protein [Fibromonadales bacterium]